MAKTPAAPKTPEIDVAAITAEAKAAADKLIADAKDQAEKIKADAKAEAETVLAEAMKAADERKAEAETLVEGAKAEAARLVEEAKAAAGPIETPPAMPADMKGGVRIRSKVDGFRRCGVEHPKEATAYPAGTFTAGQIEILKREPNLVVEDL